MKTPNLSATGKPPATIPMSSMQYKQNMLIDSSIQYVDALEELTKMESQQADLSNQIPVKRKQVDKLHQKCIRFTKIVKKSMPSSQSSAHNLPSSIPYNFSTTFDNLPNDCIENFIQDSAGDNFIAKVHMPEAEVDTFDENNVHNKSSNDLTFEEEEKYLKLCDDKDISNKSSDDLTFEEADKYLE